MLIPNKYTIKWKIRIEQTHAGNRHIANLSLVHRYHSPYTHVKYNVSTDMSCIQQASHGSTSLTWFPRYFTHPHHIPAMYTIYNVHIVSRWTSIKKKAHMRDIHLATSNHYCKWKRSRTFRNMSEAKHKSLLGLASETFKPGQH